MAENFLQYKILPKKTPNESIVRLLTDLSINKLTPIDIAEVEVTNIELKHLSYLSKTVTYEYSYRIMLGQERKIYRNEIEYRRNAVHGDYEPYNKSVYSHSVTDWSPYSKSGEFTFEKTIPLNSEIVDNIVDKMYQQVVSKIKFDGLTQNPSIILNPISDFIDTDIGIRKLDNFLDKQVENAIQGTIPSSYDKKDFYGEKQIIESNVILYSLPVYCIEYVYENKEYIAYFCDSIDYLYSAVPVDEEIKEVYDDINKISLFSVFLVVMNITISYFFWNDKVFNDIMWWMYGFTGFIIIKNMFKKFSNDKKQFSPILEEKEKRLQFKLNKLFPELMH